ncbi:MAG: hypothetical protein A2017_09055 [Lentisphaerae bacterium GWF2_44_16]|nr:MAG: hypothetical protein A2017_09055 [Lentisphaerae bacterium GWF2_44_16]
MKKILLICSILFSWINIYSENIETTIGFNDIDFGDALCKIEKVKIFQKVIRNKEILPNDHNEKEWGDGFIFLVKKYLGENNFLSFIFLNNLFDKKKFAEYLITCEIPHVTKNSTYYKRNDLFIDALWEFEIGEYNVIDKESFSDLKVIQNNADRIIAEFDFDIFKIESITGKCIFSATKGKNGKWVVQELRIKKRGSDKLEDGLLVYSRAKDKTVNKSSTKDTHQVNVESQGK